MNKDCEVKQQSVVSTSCNYVFDRSLAQLAAFIFSNIILKEVSLIFCLFTLFGFRKINILLNLQF